MRKFLKFEDGERHELSPLTYQEFTQLDRWIGGSDIAFDHFKRVNKFSEIDDFDEQLVKKMKFIDGKWKPLTIIELEEGEPKIDWTIEYGS